MKRRSGAERAATRAREDLLRSHARCAFLLYAISGGDHKALANAGDAAAEAARLLHDTSEADEWMEQYAHE